MVRVVGDYGMHGLLVVLRCLERGLLRLQHILTLALVAVVAFLLSRLLRLLRFLLAIDLRQLRDLVAHGLFVIPPEYPLGIGLILLFGTCPAQSPLLFEMLAWCLNHLL